MLKVNLSDGSTRQYDLESEIDGADWLRDSGDDEFQSSIRGISILHRKTLYAVPAPKGETGATFGAKLLRGRDDLIVGEQISCDMGDGIGGTMIVYYGDKPRMVKCLLGSPRRGTQRFDPRLVHE